jgi:hypothetical protein
MGKAVTAILRGAAPLLLLLALAAWPTAAQGHQLDEYLQATLVAIEPGDIRLLINLTPGTEVAAQVLAQIDRDGDGVISSAEAAAYADALNQDLVVRLDDRPYELTLTASNFPPPEDLRTGWGIIQLEYRVACGEFAGGPHRLTVQNRHQHNVSAYLLNAAQPKSPALQITAQKRNYNQSTGEIQFTFQSPRKAAPTAAIIGSLAALLIAGAAWLLRVS